MSRIKRLFVIPIYFFVVKSIIFLFADLDDIQSDHSIGKPVVWCESTDLDFWDKILGNETYNVIYFVNVPHEPIIEKDTKTTIYSNGTILEEITETKRDSESGKFDYSYKKNELFSNNEMKQLKILFCFQMNP